MGLLFARMRARMGVQLVVLALCLVALAGRGAVGQPLAGPQTTAMMPAATTPTRSGAVHAAAAVSAGSHIVRVKRGPSVSISQLWRELARLTAYEKVTHYFTPSQSPAAFVHEVLTDDLRSDWETSLTSPRANHNDEFFFNEVHELDVPKLFEAYQASPVTFQLNDQPISHSDLLFDEVMPAVLAWYAIELKRQNKRLFPDMKDELRKDVMEQLQVHGWALEQVLVKQMEVRGEFQEALIKQGNSVAQLLRIIEQEIPHVSEYVNLDGTKVPNERDVDPRMSDFTFISVPSSGSLNQMGLVDDGHYHSHRQSFDSSNFDDENFDDLVDSSEGPAVAAFDRLLSSQSPGFLDAFVLDLIKRKPSPDAVLERCITLLQADTGLFRSGEWADAKVFVQDAKVVAQFKNWLQNLAKRYDVPRGFDPGALGRSTQEAIADFKSHCTGHGTSSKSQVASLTQVIMKSIDAPVGIEAALKALRETVSAHRPTGSAFASAEASPQGSGIDLTNETVGADTPQV
ncbi:hypothetical protein CXG81DRAFT_16628 [Caulochytrium protostelioides]|uniref:Peptidoglycan binding-like domain-containing protein n=1 Tax=Caulochytrium protostelioides TaxID=1555241 RepID=A0A4P9XEF5_9FUNG|nr:hypothetical protein CXG81DRAFT_16628 [Caulochytrium protostelioides]|eukprot:RKP03924.1 hypothetical protein CXG81DRAFT_16628 [Caulochytrium protostelioides]